MINVEIVSEYNLWKKNIKNPKIYFKKKLKKLTKFKSLNFSSKTFTILLTNNIKMKYLNNKFRKKNRENNFIQTSGRSRREARIFTRRHEGQSRSIFKTFI